MSRTRRNNSNWTSTEDGPLSYRQRDKKAFSKPSSWFKKVKTKKRRAQQNQALREGRELEKYRKSDTWDWN